MYSPKKGLECPRDFNFPFTPYKIQQDMMESLYEVIENKRIGIFESPTGTGKSLTLTCGALKWLLDHEELVKEELSSKILEVTEEIKELERSGAKSSDWIEAQFGAIQKKDEAVSLRKMKAAIEEYEEKINKIKERIKTEKTKKMEKSKYHGTSKEEDSVKIEEENVSFEDEDAEDKQVEDGDGDEEGGFKDIKVIGTSGGLRVYSALADLQPAEVKITKRQDLIYFCSRTHSQLSQVVREVKRTFYGKQIRCISLASRQNLCINPTVKKLSSAALINEKCLEMQKSQSKTTSTDSDGKVQKKARLNQVAHCPFKSQASVEELRENCLADILDIEELISAGDQLRACPYYSGRAAAQDAQLVMLPYQMLFHKKTRLQMGIDLKKNILIIDEAHNLLDAISNIYSNEISLNQLQIALTQLASYKSKYFNRFSTKNLLKINQLIFVTKRLAKILQTAETKSRMVRTHELMSEGEFFNIDLFKILEFCENTRFAQKVHGLAQKVARDPPKEEKENEKSGTTALLRKLEEQAKCSKSGRKGKEVEVEPDEEVGKDGAQNKLAPSVIRPLLAFLESLTECAEDGMVLLKNDQDTNKAGMKFVLLNPGGHFDEIVKECRSVIIAGGTMQPVSDLLDQLFKNHLDRVQQNFYDHVVSAEAVLPFAVQKGPTGKQFLFNFSNRSNIEMQLELGMTLLNICNVIPAGIVCFFGSYDYMNSVYAFLSNQGILEKLQKRKYIFKEPRSGSGQSIEKVLAEYSVSIRDSRRNGALLFSVIGGRLSEGLNFADDLGRCVIVVGMPYPNKNSPELIEKMKYLDATLGNGAGAEYYENLCMKAVNQCIGRSVRHIKDYACVLLVDERYTSERVLKKLPAWISRSLQTPSTFGLIQGATAKFFREKRTKVEVIPT